MTPEEIKALAETVKLLTEIAETKPSQWLPLYAALGGAIAGAFASFFPTWFLELRRDKNFSRQVENCLLAEVSALLEIIENRRYLISIREVIAHLSEQPAGAIYSFTVNVPQHYSRVYQTNCSNIGAVRNEIAQKIVVFHQLIDAIVQDIKPGGIASVGATLEAYTEMEKIFSNAIDKGRDILASK